MENVGFVDAVKIHFAPRGLGKNCLPCFVCQKNRLTEVNVQRIMADEIQMEKMRSIFPAGYHESMLRTSTIGDWALVDDMACFVRTKMDGEVALGLFKYFGLIATLDYRPSEPNWIQVKIGSCEEHFKHLAELQRLVVEADCHLTAEIIKKACRPL